LWKKNISKKTGSMPSPPPYKFFDYIFLFISIVSGLTFFMLHYLEGKGTLFSAAVAFCILDDFRRSLAATPHGAAS
jgi:hypothetical protein